MLSPARALALLRNAEREPAESRGDHELHSQIGFLELLDGKTVSASAEYRTALAADPDDSVAAADLGLIEAQAHRYNPAATLWREVFARDPAQLTAGFNLAVIECGAGKPGEALETLDRILRIRARQRPRPLHGQSHPRRIACLPRTVIHPAEKLKKKAPRLSALRASHGAFDSKRTDYCVIPSIFIWNSTIFLIMS